MHSSVEIGAAIDEIYEASVAPKSWHKVLHRMAEICDAEGTLLFTWSAGGAMRWICSPEINPMVREWVSSEWVKRNARVRLLAIGESRFLTDLDGFTPEELASDPFYNEFLRPRGLGWCVGTVIRLASGASFVFSVEKAFEKGPVSPEAVQTLNRLRPHLARAAALSASIGRERAKTVVATLQAIGIPAAVLTTSGRPIVANQHFLNCAPSVTVSLGNQVSFADPKAQMEFGEALAAFDSKSLTERGRSIVVPRVGKNPMLIGHLAPFARAATDIFNDGTSILLITHLVEQTAPDPRLLVNLFDLTPTEARVASLLVEGKSVKAIARMQGVAANTVRMQLKSVFSKTGVHRQAQLVSLLAQKSLGRLSKDALS